MRMAHPFCRIVLLGVCTWAWSKAASESSTACPGELNSEKSLLIRDLSVVDSSLAEPYGPLHFTSVVKRFAPNLASNVQMTIWVERWLSQFSQSDRSDRFFVARSPERILQFWERDSSGLLDESRAPFRLLAVTVRTDLQSPEAPEGELRFVYAATDPWSSAAVEFLVIFEFAFEGQREVWANAFKNLSCLPFGPDFNRELKQRVTSPGLRFLRIRTNDFMMGRDWELREFQLNALGALELSPVAQTPKFVFSHSENHELVDWMLQNEAEILQERAILPPSLTGFTAPVPHESFSWLRGSELNEGTRRAFSKMTCNGCHAADTATVFTHIFPRGLGQRARISGFLAEDLAERARIMNAWSISKPIQVHQLSKPDPRTALLRTGRVH